MVTGLNITPKDAAYTCIAFEIQEGEQRPISSTDFAMQKMAFFNCHNFVPKPAIPAVKQ